VILINKAIAPVSKDDIRSFLDDNSQAFRELLSYYHCAMLEVETKFRVLNEEMNLKFDYNPIESIKTRLKTKDSLIDKISRYELPLNINAIEDGIPDIAGVRVICSYVSDIYTLADSFLSQDDIILQKRKDYIAHPKESGYRSLHLIVSIPIFLHDRKKYMKVEVQFRTLAMDMWASLEHKIRYKKDKFLTESEINELFACSELSAEVDKRLEAIHRVSDERYRDLMLEGGLE